MRENKVKVACLWDKMGFVMKLGPKWRPKRWKSCPLKRRRGIMISAFVRGRNMKVEMGNELPAKQVSAQRKPAPSQIKRVTA